MRSLCWHEEHGWGSPLNRLQWYLRRTYQSRRRLEQGWAPTGLVWRCRGPSPADHQRIRWWRWLLKRQKKEDVTAVLQSAPLYVTKHQSKRGNKIFKYILLACFSDPLLLTHWKIDSKFTADKVSEITSTRLCSHFEATLIISLGDVHTCGREVWKRIHTTALQHGAANENRAQVLTNVNVKWPLAVRQMRPNALQEVRRAHRCASRCYIYILFIYMFLSFFIQPLCQQCSDLN